MSMIRGRSSVATRELDLGSDQSPNANHQPTSRVTWNDSWRRRWHLPGDRPQPYAVYVDDTDAVWVNDWGANAILSFDPKTDRRAPRRRAPRAAWSWLKQTDLIPDKGQLR